MKVGIVGGGIMGLMMAYYAIKAGFSVVMLNDDSKKNCSSIAAGLLAPISESEKSPRFIYEMGIHSLKIEWPNVLSTLPFDIEFQNKGSIFIAHSADKKEFCRVITSIYQTLSINAIGYQLSSDDLKKLEPELKHQHAYYFQDEGFINVSDILFALKTYIQNYANYIANVVEAINIDLNCVITKDNKYFFDFIIDCRGLGANYLLKELRSIRGELIWVSTQKKLLSRPVRFLHPRYQLYIVPRRDNTYIVGASEIESNDLSPISVLTTLELLSALYAVHPAFSESVILKTESHCRPAFLNHLPKIFYSKTYIHINGLYRHGFLLAPSIASDVILFIQKGFNAIQKPMIWETL